MAYTDTFFPKETVCILRIVYVQRKVWKLTMLILGNGTGERVHKFMFLCLLFYNEKVCIEF